MLKNDGETRKSKGENFPAFPSILDTFPQPNMPSFCKLGT